MWRGTVILYSLFKKAGFWSSASITLTYNVVIDERGGLPWSCKKDSLLKLLLKESTFLLLFIIEKYIIILEEKILFGFLLLEYNYKREKYSEEAFVRSIFCVFTCSMLRIDTHRSSESIYSVICSIYDISVTLNFIIGLWILQTVLYRRNNFYSGIILILIV